MITPYTQRWCAGRSSWRAADEVSALVRYDVALIPGDQQAKSFVVLHHYSGSYPAARFRVGLYRDGQLVGVAVFSVPVTQAVLITAFRGLNRPPPSSECVELGRLVLLDDVPANAESWFLARAFHLLRSEGFAGVLSMSDPVPRIAVDGLVVMPGHIGIIYQASNAVYLGRATPRLLRLLPDGRCVNGRTLQKIRSQERGWEYGVRQLVEWGAVDPGSQPSKLELQAWLVAELPRITRPLRHGGCHRYAWLLHRGRHHRDLGRLGLAYPRATKLDQLTLFGHQL